MAYNRYDQERFNTQKGKLYHKQTAETAGFKINTLGSFKGLMTKMVNPHLRQEPKAEAAPPITPGIILANQL